MFHQRYRKYWKGGLMIIQQNKFKSYFEGWNIFPIISFWRGQEQLLNDKGHRNFLTINLRTLFSDLKCQIWSICLWQSSFPIYINVYTYRIVVVAAEVYIVFAAFHLSGTASNCHYFPTPHLSDIIFLPHSHCLQDLRGLPLLLPKDSSS